MKQKSLSKKLVIVKTTVSDLDTNDMGKLRGGVLATQRVCTDPDYCHTIRWTNCYTCRPCLP